MTQPVSEDAYVTVWHLVLHFTSLKDNKPLRRHETTHASTIDIHQRIWIDYISPLLSLTLSFSLFLSISVSHSLLSLSLFHTTYKGEGIWVLYVSKKFKSCLSSFFFLNWDFSTLNWGSIVSQ